MNAEKTYKEGELLGMWMGIGAGVGVALMTPIALFLDMMAFLGLGPAFGVGIGLSIGAGLEAKYKKVGRVIAYTEEEKEANKGKAKKAIFIVLGVVVFLVLGLIILVRYLK